MKKDPRSFLHKPMPSPSSLAKQKAVKLSDKKFNSKKSGQQLSIFLSKPSASSTQSFFVEKNPLLLHNRRHVDSVQFTSNNRQIQKLSQQRQISECVERQFAKETNNLQYKQKILAHANRIKEKLEAEDQTDQKLQKNCRSLQETLKNQKDSLSNESKRLQLNIKQFSDQKLILEKELQVLLIKHESTQSKVSTMKHLKGQLETENSKLNRELIDLNQTLNNQRLQVHSLQRQEEQKTKQLTQAFQQHKSCIIKQKELKEKLFRIREAVHAQKQKLQSSKIHSEEVPKKVNRLNERLQWIMKNYSNSHSTLEKEYEQKLVENTKLRQLRNHIEQINQMLSDGSEWKQITNFFCFFQGEKQNKQKFQAQKQQHSGQNLEFKELTKHSEPFKDKPEVQFPLQESDQTHIFQSALNKSRDDFQQLQIKTLTV